jgi:hypothetical protein
MSEKEEMKAICPGHVYIHGAMITRPFCQIRIIQLASWYDMKNQDR